MNCISWCWRSAQVRPDLGELGEMVMLAVLAHGVPDSAKRCLGNWLHCTPGCPAASVPGAGLAPLLRRIGVVRPRRLDLGRVPGAVRLAADSAGFLRPPHRRLADPELAGKPPITGHAH